jgi:hypothetical protein
MIYKNKDIIYMSTVANLFVYVKTGEGTVFDSLKKKIIEKSQSEGFTDRIFFLEDSAEIITHGNVFGLSTETAAAIKAAQEDIKGLESAVASATGFVKSTAEDGSVSYTSEIADDSVIAKYVAEKVAASAAVINDSETITTQKATDDKGTTTYSLDVVSSALVDGKTLSVNGNKISAAIDLVYESASDDNGNKPYMYLVDNEGTMISAEKVDVSDFIVDGMVEKVDYNATTGVITITWNTDGGSKTTDIDVKKLFKLEEVHVADDSKDYIQVTKTDPTGTDTPHEGDVKDGVCYEVKTKVDGTDLTIASTIEKTEANAEHNIKAEWSHKTTSGLAANNWDEIGNNGKLADITKVATKIGKVEDDIVEVANIALENSRKIDSASSDVDAKLLVLKKALYGAEIDAETAPADTIESNKAAIDVLNGDETVAGSVDAKIAALKASLKKDAAEATDVNKLVTITSSETDGIASIDKVEVKVNTLMEKVSSVEGAGDLPYVQIADGQYYLSKSLDAVAADDPSIVTTQDAYLYGKAILAKAVASIKSDNNQYIKIDYQKDTNTSSIVYEPWAEVSSVDDLNNLYNE